MIRVGDVDVDDQLPIVVASVVGDEPVRAGADRGCQMDGVGPPEPVAGAKCGRQRGDRPVDGTQVQPGQLEGEPADLSGLSLSDRPGQQFRDEDGGSDPLLSR